MKLCFWKADIFAENQAVGFPAACVRLPDVPVLAAGQLQAIARELAGYAVEVCFAAPAGQGFALRCFTAARELPACGASAIAALVALAGELPAGEVVPLAVGQASTFARRSLDGGWQVATLPTAPERLPMTGDDLWRALNLDDLYLDGGHGPALMAGALRTLIVPMRTAAALTDLQPDRERLTNLAGKYGLDYVLVCTADRVLPSSDWRTRVFAPRLGHWEEAASGPANAALGACLLAHGKWRGGKLTVEQGRSYRNPALIHLVVEGSQILFGDGARIRIEGSYLL